LKFIETKVAAMKPDCRQASLQGFNHQLKNKKTHLHRQYPIHACHSEPDPSGEESQINSTGVVWKVLVKDFQKLQFFAAQRSFTLF